MPGLHAQVARASPPPHAARGGLLQDSLGWLRAGICVFVFRAKKSKGMKRLQLANKTGW